MTTPTSAQELPPADPTAGGDAAGQGRLEIADRVIERIAAQAAAEVARATGASRRVLGVSLGTQDERPDVTAHVDGDIATVDVVMSVAWPAPVAEVTEQVRARIVQQLADLADVRTAQVDIRVTALVAERRDDRRVH
ncbi:MAG: Asp23/Gls24 family envelope stress response protein [Blastococcus sp.]|nr:Asp23/Gls24 family envelope stress response protein [Blastococcus sp.]